MSTCVCVLSNNGERLMPTIRLGKVRRLLKDGKAKIVKHHPDSIHSAWNEFRLFRKRSSCSWRLDWHSDV